VHRDEAQGGHSSLSDIRHNFVSGSVNVVLMLPSILQSGNELA